MKLQPTPVRLLAEEAGLPVQTPEDVNTPKVLETLRAWAPNVIVVVAFGQILKKPVLELPPLGCVNVHPSLLPRYRGAAPMQRAIMDGQTETGMTICRMVRKLDSGDILLQQRMPIGQDENFAGLHDRLADSGADLLVEALKSLASGRAEGKPQDDAAATYAPKIEARDEWIRWCLPAEEIRNLVRALDTRPGARATLASAGKKQEVKIWSARCERGDGPAALAGTITQVSPDRLIVATGGGLLNILEIQSAGKTRMPVQQWLIGHRVREGDAFENVAN